MSEQAVGKSLNLTFDVSSGGVIALRMVDNGGRALDMAGVTPWGEIDDEHTVEKLADLGCSWGASGEILVDFPAMERGRYVFHVFLRNDDGADVVGVAGYVGYSAPKTLREESDIASVNRTLRVVVNGESVRALWSRTSAAEEAYKRVKEAQDSVSEDIEALEGAKEVIERLHGEIADAITINPDGNWVIGGVPTGMPSQGPRGEKGMDADTVKRVEINSVSELPTDAEHTSGRYIYYVKSGEGQGAYIWGEGFDGTLTWLKVGDPSDLKFATTDNAGIVLLSSNEVTAFGAGVHKDASGRIRVDDATPARKGAVRLSYESTDTDMAEECIGATPSKVVSGQNIGQGIGVRRATGRNYGVVRITGLAIGTENDLVPTCRAVTNYVAPKAQEVLNSYVSDAGGSSGNELTSLINSLIDAKLNQVAAIPAGVEADYAGTAAPSGWLICDGRAVSRTTYANLFMAIGTIYGAGDGSTTFNLPNRRDLVTIMPSNIGKSGGRAVGSIQNAYAPNITGRFICDDQMSGKAWVNWNQQPYNSEANAEVAKEGCFKGVVYRGSAYVPSEWQQSLIVGPQSERFKIMDTSQSFILYDNASSFRTIPPSSTHDGSNAYRMTFDASRSSNVYQDGATTLMPRNAAVLKIIKY